MNRIRWQNVKTAVWLVLACLMAFSRLSGQEAPLPPAKKAFFWKASSGNHAVYLLGSIHIGTKEMYPLPKEVEEAFENSSALAVEVDVKHVDKQKMQALIFQKGLYQGDDSLWNHVGAETKKRVELFCVNYGIPSERIAKLKPWLAAFTAAGLQIMKNGYDPSLGIDMHFLDEADRSESKKRIVEIESVESQINLLSGLGEGSQEKFLADAVQEKSRATENIKRIKDLWLSGDAEKLGGLMSDEFTADEEIQKTLLQDRNPHMADVAEQFLARGEPGFIVVGAAHLVGEEGVIRILEKRGYKLEQLAVNQTEESDSATILVRH